MCLHVNGWKNEKGGKLPPYGRYRSEETLKTEADVTAQSASHQGEEGELAGGQCVGDSEERTVHKKKKKKQGVRVGGEETSRVTRKNKCDEESFGPTGLLQLLRAA